ncbi:MAG: tetratricopeptide (TPR) repeat protein [Arcticibacterium sp.]|jgi:tetratricopeptide (TPR) repeat protein|tara:strand:+ start:465 stop:1163 length:699 start_codon:yes stop_codon:yes gene_type:complete
MKKLLLAALLFSALGLKAQQSSDLQKHYEAFYKQMRVQADVNGVVQALTHLNVLEPTIARRDTLAYVYSSNNQYIQALNLLGIEKLDTDSDLAVQVKAISLKALEQPKRALEHFEILAKRNPTAYLFYEVSDLKIVTGDNAGAIVSIKAGQALTKADMKYAFYERQQPYEVSLKSAFFHLEALVIYNTDKEKIKEAIALIDRALVLSPNFNLASMSRQALESRVKAEEAPKE